LFSHQTTLRSYLDVLKVQDDSFTHKNFQRAIQGVLNIYIHLLECPEDIDGLGHLTPADRKKERAKQKKKKMQKDDDTAKIQTTEDDSEVKIDTDPDGELLLQKDFLLEAASWCSHLQNRLHLCSSETLTLFAEVMSRRGKHLQAIRALKLALDQNINDPVAVPVFVKYMVRLKNKKFSNMNAVVMNVVKQEIAALLKSGGVASVNEFAEKFSTLAMETHSLIMLLASVKCFQLLDKNNTTKVAELLNSVDLVNGQSIEFKEVSKLLTVSLYLA
jgi:hypothetical protein